VPIDGLLVEGNDVSISGRNKARGIHVLSQDNKRIDGRKVRKPLPIKDVRIVGNTTRGGGICVIGTASGDCVIRDNKHFGGEPGLWENAAELPAEGNENYDQ
jgi:hypothetical protein